MCDCPVVSDCPQAIVYRKYAKRHDCLGDATINVADAGAHYEKAVYYHGKADAANRLYLDPNSAE